MSIPVVFPSVERTYLTDKYACWWMAYHVPLNITRLHSMILTTLVVYRIQKAAQRPTTPLQRQQIYRSSSLQVSTAMVIIWSVSSSQPPINELTFQRQSNDYVGQAEEFQPFIQCKWGVQVHMGHMHIHAVVPKQQFSMHHATCILTYIFTYIQPVQTISAMSMVWLG